MSSWRPSLVVDTSERDGKGKGARPLPGSVAFSLSARPRTAKPRKKRRVVDLGGVFNVSGDDDASPDAPEGKAGGGGDAGLPPSSAPISGPAAILRRNHGKPSPLTPAGAAIAAANVLASARLVAGPAVSVPSPGPLSPSVPSLLSPQVAAVMQARALAVAGAMKAKAATPPATGSVLTPSNALSALSLGSPAHAQAMAPPVPVPVPVPVVPPVAASASPKRGSDSGDDRRRHHRSHRHSGSHRHSEGSSRRSRRRHEDGHHRSSLDSHRRHRDRDRDRDRDKSRRKHRHGHRHRRRHRHRSHSRSRHDDDSEDQDDRENREGEEGRAAVPEATVKGDDGVVPAAAPAPPAGSLDEREQQLRAQLLRSFLIAQSKRRDSTPAADPLPPPVDDEDEGEEDCEVEDAACSSDSEEEGVDSGLGVTPVPQLAAKVEVEVEQAAAPPPPPSVPPPPPAPPVAAAPPPPDDADGDLALGAKVPALPAAAEAAALPPPAAGMRRRRSASVDMFGDESPGGAAGEEEPLAPVAEMVASAGAGPAGVDSDYDDEDGYYRFMPGEVIRDRYRVLELCGKGVFSTVLRACDMEASPPRNVAIKVVRANDMMARAAEKEAGVLMALANADTADRKRCVRLLATFAFRGHQCLVFESLQCDLRKLNKQYGSGCGLSLDAVRAYGRQLFTALAHVHDVGYVHADVKPDNMLVGGGKHTLLKLSDFGTAIPNWELPEYARTTYIGSRYYRAPEIVLGGDRGPGVDVWAAGCVLYELATGAFCFSGTDNLELLASMGHVLGEVPPRILRKAPFRDRYYTAEDALAQPADRAPLPTPAAPGSHAASWFQARLIHVLRKGKVRAAKARHPDKPRRHAKARSLTDAEKQATANLADLLVRLFQYDPTKRPNAKEALKHGFFKKAPKGK